MGVGPRSGYGLWPESAVNSLDDEDWFGSACLMENSANGEPVLQTISLICITGVMLV